MASPSDRWPDALLVGLACSMRTTAGPAALAARGRITGRARGATLLAGAGELTVDKLPVASDRIAAPAVAGRVASGAYSGRQIAGGVGAASGAIGALVGTYATWRARRLAGEATGLADPAIAAGEDVLALTAAAIATRPTAGPPDRGEPGGRANPPRRSTLRGAAKGVAAGLAGTAAMTIAQGAKFVLTRAEPSDAPATVVDKMKRRLGRGRLKRRHRPAANQAMHWLFGASWGVPLGLLDEAVRPRPEVAGPAFGLAVWGAALVHQPLVGVAEPPWKRSPASLGSEALLHVVYGIGAAAALRTMRR